MGFDRKRVAGDQEAAAERGSGDRPRGDTGRVREHWAHTDWSFQGYGHADAERPVLFGTEPAGVVQRQVADDPDPLGIRLRTAELFDAPIPPEVVDAMIRDTEAITRWVNRQVDAGLQVDGMTYFYKSDDAYARGLVKHWPRATQDPRTGEWRQLTDEEVLAQTRAAAKGSVAMTMVGSDSTIHINTGTGDHSFRTILHEAMHQRAGVAAMANFGGATAEGLAEFLSEIVLKRHGVAFRPHGPYASAYRFVKYLAEVFGEELLVRAVLTGDIGVLRAEFDQYATDATKNWKKFQGSMMDGEFELAREALSGFVSQRAVHKPGDEAAEAADAAFWDEAERMQRDLEKQHERGTWRESDDPVRARIVAMNGGAAHAVLTLSRGGQHGVREGWLVEFGPESDFAGEACAVTEVDDRSCRAFVARPLASLEREPAHEVTIRKS